MIRNVLNFCCTMFVFVAFGTGCMFAQTSNAQISGLVMDSSGASAPGTQLTAVNDATRTEYTTTSNEAGVYVIPEMVPGKYTITVLKDGFQTFVQSGVTLRTGDRASLNFTLRPGTTRSEVTVTAESTLITTDDASNSNVLDNKMITQLPQLTRSSLDLTKVSPSVQGAGPKEAGKGYDASIGVDGSSYSLAAGQVNGAVITVDGANVQDAEFNVINRAIPSPDVVGEFRVQTGVLTADYGRYSGGVIVISSQSGTNQLHGRLFGYYRTHKLNSNDWLNNALGVEKLPFHQSDYGLAFGGPVVIPKLYNGRNKTFFFVGWEGERFATSALVRSSVPTALERQGNFSQSIINFQNGQPVYARIFDPFHGYTDANGNWVRPEFPNATIPAAMQTQVFKHYMDLWPMPNHAPDADTSSTNNYWSTARTPRPTDRQSLRLDQNFSNSQRANFRISHYHMTDTRQAPFLHATGEQTTDLNWSGGMQYTWVLSPTTIIDATVGVSIANLLNTLGAAPDLNINTDQWGFDPTLFSGGLRSNAHIPPQTSGSGYTEVGGQFYDKLVQQIYNANIGLTKIIGRHTIKAGYQEYFSMFRELGGDASGATWVTPGGGSNQFWNNPDGLTGNPLAEYMLGSSSFYTWGNWNITPATQNQAAFVMDDWKVNTKLSVQMGLRWDHDSPRTLRYKGTGVFFDTNAKNVLKPNADWNWNQVVQAVPALSNYPAPSWLSNGVNGRVSLIDTPEYPQKNLYTTNWANFQPRLGISYALTKNTVIHAAGGIIYQGLNGLGTEGASIYYPTPTFSQIPTLDGKHWVSEMGTDHGLGSFPLQPDGTRLGYFLPARNNSQFWNLAYGACANPNGICNVFTPHMDSPEEYTWSFSVQRQLGSSWVVSADYTGIRGIHLMTPAEKYQYTNAAPTYYSLGSALRQQVPNPFYGQSQTFASEPTVPLAQLLSSMPQYSGAGPGLLTWGKSRSQFLNLQIQTRNYKGLTLLASYAIRKTLTNNAGKDYRHGGPLDNGTFLQNPQDFNEGYGVALYEFPQTLLLNYSYELPFGRGHKLLAGSGWKGRALDLIAGGWAAAGVTTWRPHGVPVIVPRVSGSVTAPGTASVRWSVKPGVNYLNPSRDDNSAIVVSGKFVNSNPSTVFSHDAYVRTPNYSFGNLPFVYPNVRNPGMSDTDATLMKNFYMGESHVRYFNFRLEALNILNHPNLGTIITNPDSATFGGIRGKSGSRTVQLGLRFFF